MTNQLADQKQEVDDQDTAYKDLRQQWRDAPTGTAAEKRDKEDIRSNLVEARADLEIAQQRYAQMSAALRDEKRSLDAVKAARTTIMSNIDVSSAVRQQQRQQQPAGQQQAAIAGQQQQQQAPSSTYTDKDWQIYVNTKGAQQHAIDHKWSTDCNPLQVINEAVSYIQCSWRNAPLIHSSYYDFLHNTPSNSTFQPGLMSAHLTPWLDEYMHDHPGWATFNHVGDQHGQGRNVVGTESLFINGKQRTCGVVMYDAFIAEIDKLKKGYAHGLPTRHVVLPAISPMHDEDNVSCTPRTHLRHNEYCALDENVCGVIMLLITPEHGRTKPSFWERCNEIYQGMCTNGSKTFRMVQTIMEYQPVSHSVLARTQEDHFKQPYKENCALHVYFDKVLIQYCEFQREHGVATPAQYTSFDSLVWNEMCHCIRKNFLPEEAEHKNEYYRRLSEIGKVLAEAYSNGAYDQTVIDASSTLIREHFNPTKGHQLILKCVTDIYTMVYTKGSWRPTPPLESWTLPSYNEDRFGAAPSAKRHQAHYLEDDDDDDFRDQCHYGGADDAGEAEGTLDDIVAECFQLHDEGYLEDDIAEQLNMCLDDYSSDNVDQDEVHSVFVAALTKGRRNFSLLAPSKADPKLLSSNARERRDAQMRHTQQQQPGSYGNPRSATPSRGSNDYYRKAGYKGKGKFTPGQRRFNTRDNRQQNGGRSSRDEGGRDGRQSGRQSSTFGQGSGRQGQSRDQDNRANMRDRINNLPGRWRDKPQQQPFVRTPPQPSTQPGRQIYDRIRLAVGKLKRISHANPEIKGVLDDLNIYRNSTNKLAATKSRESVHKSTVDDTATDTMVDALYALNENADDLTDAELEQTLFMLSGGTDDDDDHSYMMSDSRWIDLETESGSTHRLYFTEVDGQLRWIVDTGGSRDLCQNKSRFVPGSLKKLLKPIAIHMAQGAVYATHIGVIKYSVRAPDHYGRSNACFTWLSLGLYVPKMEADLAIMSVPSHQRLGVSLKAEGDDVTGAHKQYTTQPYVYASGQTVLGHSGVTCRTLRDNGESFRGVETQSAPNSNMLLLQCIDEDEASQLKQIHLITGEPYNMRDALKLLRTCCPRLKGFASVQSHCAQALDDALAHAEGTYMMQQPSPTSLPRSKRSSAKDIKSFLKNDRKPSLYTQRENLESDDVDDRSDTHADQWSPDAPCSNADKTEHAISDTDIDVDVAPQASSPSHGTGVRGWLKAFVARSITARTAHPRVPSKPPTLSTSTKSKPDMSGFKDPNYKLKVLMLCCGLASLMFGGWSRMRTEVVGLCEVNPVFHPYYKRYAPRAAVYDDMRALKRGLETGDIPHFHVDCIECSAPCTGRNSLRWHNNRQHDTELDADNDLFLMVSDIARMLMPSYVVCEMTPEHEHSGADYDKLVTRMRDVGYTPHIMPRLNACECGDATSRDRFFACFIHTSVPRHKNFVIEAYTGNGEGRAMTPMLDKPSEIPPHCWVTDRFLTREGGDIITSADNSRIKFQSFPILRASHYTRSAVRSFLSFTDKFQDRFRTYAILLGSIFTTSTLGGKVYSRHGPYVTITREARGMIFDDREDIYSGVRYPTVNELAKFSGFIGPQRAFLLSLPTEKEALTIIAGAITYNTSKTVWSAVCDHAFSDYEHNFFFSGKSLHSLSLDDTPSTHGNELNSDDYDTHTFEIICRVEDLSVPRQPKPNWTDDEIARGFVDEDLTLPARVKRLNAEGYEYRHDLAIDFRDKPSERRRIDCTPRTPYGALATEDGTCVRTWRRADGTEYVERGAWIELPRQGHHPSLGYDTTRAQDVPTQQVDRKLAHDAAPDAHARLEATSSSRPKPQGMPVINPFERFPVKDTLDLSAQGRAHIPTSDYAPLPAANSEAGLKRAHAAWKLHQTLCPCSPETFENTIAISAHLDGVRQGDSRIVRHCPKCLRFNNDFWRSGQTSKSDTRMYRRHPPGTAVSLDGANAKTVSQFGFYKIILIVIDLGSLKTYTAYLKGDSSREFIEAMDNIRKQLHLETGNKLKHVTSDAFSTYLEHTGVADWRDVHGIELLPNPADYKEWNAYAENRIRHLKRKARSNLEELKGLEIAGRTIGDPTAYWPFAWEHARQASNMCTHSTLEKWHGFPCSPDQAASGDFTPRKVRLLPFASVGYMHIEKKHRHHPLEPTNERCYFMFNAQSNLLIHKFSNMYRGHVVLTADRGSLQSTGKVVWAHSATLDQLARDSQKHLPGGGGATRNEPLAITGSESDDQPVTTDNFARPTAFSQSPSSGNTESPHVDGGAQMTAPGPGTIQSRPTFPLAASPTDDAPAKSRPDHDQEPSSQPEPPIPGPQRPFPVPPDQNPSDDPVTDAPGSSPPAEPPPEPLPTPDTYIGRRCTRIFDGKVFDAVVISKGVEKRTGRTLWHIRHTADGDEEDLYTEELIPCLKDDTAAVAAAIPDGTDVPAPDELPSLSSLFKRNEIGIKLLKPDAKMKTRNGQPSRSYTRWEKYKHAKTIGEFKSLGGTSADFINDFGPTRRYFTFTDADMARQHLKWLDDGGELPAFYVNQVVQKATHSLYQHPAVMDAILRLDANAVMGLDGPNRLAGAAYKTIKQFSHSKKFLERNLYAGRPETLALEEIREQVMWYSLTQPLHSIELAMYNKDDILLDQSEIAALRDIPEHQQAGMLEAIVKEIGGLLDLNTFEFVSMDRVRSNQVIPTKLVLKVKTRADGSFDKNKARLVVQGFHQRIGKDFYSTFSPMASLTSVRMVLAIAVKQNQDLIHMDVPQAFIRSFVDAEIYVRLPKGVNIMALNDMGKRVPLEKANKVLRLLKSLYGIKQAPQLWNKELTRFLGTIGFQRLESESSVYVKHDGAHWSLILAEVDDLIITSTKSESITELHKAFVKQWDVKDWEVIRSFLGINMCYDKVNGVLAMDVKAKIDDFFKAHPTLAKLGSSNVPYCETNVKAAQANPTRSLRSSEQYMKDHFASIVGTLIYMSITVRPDITYAVNQMAKGMHNPELPHIVAMTQTLKYLNSHRSLALVYRRGSNQVDGLFRALGGMDGALQSLVSTSETPGDPIVLFSDSDFANDPKTRKSISGKATYYAGCLIGWQSKRQPIIATSTHEAEIIAMSLTAREGIWQRKLLTEIGVHANNDLLVTDGRLNATPLLSDNKASTFTANNPSTGDRSKHIDVHHLKVREYVNSGDLRVVHIRTDYNVSDFFTKGLTIQKFASFRDYLMGEQPTSPTKAKRMPAAAPVFGAGG